jgi:hypothetical protein
MKCRAAAQAKSRTLSAVKRQVSVGYSVGGRDDHVGRHGQAHVETAVLEVELALAEVLLRVPAPHVVVDRHARIPLRHLVDRRPVDVFHAHPAAVGTEREGPAQLQHLAASGRERPGQIDPHDRAIHQVWQRRRRRRLPSSRRGDRRLAHLEQAHRHLGPLGAEPRVLPEHPVPAALVVEQVLIELQPHVAERVGRVVGVGDPLLAPNRARGCVERGANDIIGALLPVRRPRLAAAGADRRRRGQVQPLEPRRGAGITGRGALRGERLGEERHEQAKGTRSHGTRPPAGDEIAAAALSPPSRERGPG